jgi:hypothetical protein
VDSAGLKQMIAEQQAVSRSAEGHALGMLAFRYGFALVEMVKARWEWHYDPSAASYLGAINQIHHTTRRAEPRDTYFVTPLVDAPYSRTFVDLSQGPMVLEVPVIDDRYFTVQILDMYTNSFAYVGTSQGDTRGGRYLLTAPGWRGRIPDGITRVINSPTPTACLLARVTILDDDVPAAVALQTLISVTALSEYKLADPPPYRDYRDGDPLDFFRMLAEALDEQPPPAADAGVLGSLERIGIRAHHPFDESMLHPKAVEGMAAAVKAGLQSLYAEAPFLGPSRNGWILPDPDRVGAYGTDYWLRAEVAQVGLLANSAREAYYIGMIFDSEGNPLSGEHRYQLHFGKDDFPPVEAFWSLTMYLNPEGFLVENPASIYHLGSLTKNLTYNADGSLDLYLQRDDPGPGKSGNWLPTTEPGKPFRMVLRQYLPQPEILSGHYTPPPVTRLP